MASILALSASSPLREPQRRQSLRSSDIIARSHSSAGSGASFGTVQHNRLRSLSSGSSLSSLSSLVAPAFRRNDERSNASRSLSSHNLALRQCPTGSDRRSFSGSGYSRRTSFASILTSRRRSDLFSAADNDETRLLDVAENENEMAAEHVGDELDLATGQRAFSVAGDVASATSAIDEIVRSPTCARTQKPAESPTKSRPRRWLSTLRRRKQQPLATTTPVVHRFALDDFDVGPQSVRSEQETHHKKSESWSSSLRLVTAVRSATATLASISIATASRKNIRVRRGCQRSSVMSGSEPRPSIDSQRSVMDEAANKRSKRRRDKLEELIRSEESYLADVKALSNAYFTVLGHQPTATSFTRSSAQKNISDILHLHDEILGHLHRLVPFAEYDQSKTKVRTAVTLLRSHLRWHSVDVVPIWASPGQSRLTTVRQGRRSLNISRSSEQDHRLLHCSPQTTASVAKMFLSHVPRFDLYEKYGSNYELVLRDIEETRRSAPSWSDFDRAIEALSVHVNPMKSRQANQRKAMTVKDLLIKPVQRLPRYELLFDDMCKLTPVCDDPEANSTLQDLLVRLKETCQKVNKAKDNPLHVRSLEATCLLGDRLSFSNQVPKSVFLQLLGQVSLCGCLYIAYRGKSVMKGRYVICVLFDSTMLLASAENDQTKYATLAGIPLANTTVVEADNGKGLQCYTAPHCWKVVFEHSARMYEVVMTACSATEADAWRCHLSSKIEAQAQAVADDISSAFELQSPLTAEMRSVGKAFGKPGSFVRRMSVHRAATVGPNTDLNQVIIKNTQAVKEAIDSASHTSLQIPRSQSVATPSHVQTLAPRRADRIRLESLLSDVWTRDVLPYPGMQPRLSDPIRASANHVIRKFSMASITSNFTSSKRSASYTSISNSTSSRQEDMPPPPNRKTLRRDQFAVHSRTPRSPLVDFHNAPEAFLPADFELQNLATKRKKSAFRTLTMTMERPFSPLLGTESRSQSGLRRAQSVHDVQQKPATPTPPVDLSGNDKEHTQPVYSVIQGRAHTSAGMQRSETSGKSDETVVPIVRTHDEGGKEPRKPKSRNKLLRLFA